MLLCHTNLELPGTNITWMSCNFLHLIDSKEEVILISPHVHNPGNSNILSSSLGALSLHIQEEARNLGVIFDSELSFDSQVTKVIQSFFAQLRQLSRIKSFFLPVI